MSFQKRQKKSQVNSSSGSDLLYSENWNKKLLEIHSIEGETSDVIVNAILNSAENSTLRIHLFFSKIKTRNLMMHDSIMAEKEHFFFSELMDQWNVNVLRNFCSEHIVPNCFQRSTNNLMITVKNYSQNTEMFTDTHSNLTTESPWQNCWLQKFSMATHAFTVI